MSRGRKRAPRDTATCRARIAAAASEIVKNGYGVAVAAISYGREKAYGDLQPVIICVRGFISWASGKERDEGFALDDSERFMLTRRKKLASLLYLKLRANVIVYKCC